MKKKLCFLLSLFILLLSFTNLALAIDLVSVKKIQTELDLQLKQWLRGGIEAALPRSDGFIYTVDVGQLLLYAALHQDRELYTSLRDFAVKNLVINNPQESFTQGFVLWRYKKGMLPDASGTTEALRLAEGLYWGSLLFKDKTDLNTALEILEGYARHAREDQGMWFIQNYYNIGNRSFANNSFLVDYDPDFIFQVATQVGDANFRNLAQKSYQLINRAISPCGLFYEVIQPEIATLLPKELAIFSPNDVIKLANSTTVAERVVNGQPALAKGVLDFSLKKAMSLNTFYLGRTGKPTLSNYLVGPQTYSGLVRLAIHLKNEKALKTFLPILLKHAENFLKNPEEPRFFFSSEILLALHFVTHPQQLK